MKRIFTIALVAILCFVMVLPFVGTTVEAATGSNGGKFTNELSRTTKEITLKNGTKTGVMWTQAKINGPYYGNKDLVVNIAEFDLANTHLSVEVLNHGTYLVDRKTSMATEINKYNTAHPGQTILAAVNGDLFMTSSHSNSNVTTKVLAVSRGIQIIDGEIWATQQTTQENIKATGFDGGKPVDEKNAFGVTSSNQPIVGAPMFTVTMSGNGKTVKTDGLNRLPAIDSITVYNHRVNSSNYALNDSYEIELEVVGSAAFSLNSTVTAKVKAIYPAGSTTRPTIGSNTIVVTARGSRISEVQNKFPVGTNVTFTTTVTDSMNPASMWKTVHDAIGGYILVVKDNAPVVWNTTTSGYPSSFIGIKDDGTVGFVTVTRATNEAYSSLNRNQAYAFCMEYGYNRVFHLDGGGSCTFYTLENGTYTRRTTGSDGGGAERTVINSVAVVWNDTPVCAAQGSMSHLRMEMDLANTDPNYLDGELISAVVATNNSLVSSGSKLAPNGAANPYDCEWMYNPEAASDPYVYLNYSLLKRTNAENYRYVVIRYLSTMSSAHNLSIFYNCGSQTAASSNRVKTVTVQPSGNMQYVVFDMQGASGWNGQLNNIRVDFADGTTVPAMNSFFIQRVALCKDMTEVEQVKAGGQPGVCVHRYSTKTTKKATCLEQGEKTSTCSICGDVRITKTNKLTHKLSTTEQPATCTEPASTVTVCTREGCTHKEVTPVDGSTALGHDTKVTTKKATCTKAGEKVTTCSRCDLRQTETIKKLGHDYKVTVTDPTCTEPGKTVTACTRCDDSKTETVDPLGHDTTVTTTEPTCTEDGRKVTTCSRCDLNEIETITALGHDHQVAMTDATCTADGQKVTTCSRCDLNEIETITALGHDHQVAITPATCTVDGQKVTTCSRCDFSETETITASGHTYADGSCQVCGEAEPVTEAPETDPPATEPADTEGKEETAASAVTTAGEETSVPVTEAPVTTGDDGSSTKTVAIVLIAVGGVGAIVAIVLIATGKKKKL